MVIITIREYRSFFVNSDLFQPNPKKNRLKYYLDDFKEVLIYSILTNRL